MAFRAVAFAFAGGALLASSFLFSWAWLGALLALVAFVLSQRDGLCPRIGSAVAFGWVAFVGGYHWLQPSLAAFWDGNETLAWVAWLALAAWFCLRFVLVAAGYYVLDRRGAPVALAITVPWVVVEGLYPSLFPFFVSSPWVDRTLWVGLVPLGGPLLLSALLCVIAAMLVEMIEDVRRAHTLRTTKLATLVGVVVVASSFGAWSNIEASQAMQRGEPLRVGIVQGAVDVEAGRAERVLAHRRYLEHSRALTSRDAIDLLIWPETAYALPLSSSLPMSGRLVQGDLTPPLLFGAVVESGEGRGRWNSALLVGSDGRIESGYHKRYLIPFAEAVPFAEWLPRAAEMVPSGRAFEPGRGGAVVQLDEYRLSTPICYEAIHPRYVRRLVREGRPHLLVTLANDGWFSDTPAPRIHLMLARMRAAEHRRYLVRATNTGISAIVDPLGRLLDETPLQKPATLVGEARWLDGQTLYGRFGDWPVLAVLAWLVGWGALKFTCSQAGPETPSPHRLATRTRRRFPRRGRS